jgi:plasmid stabilization system protein ParE
MSFRLTGKALDDLDALLLGEAERSGWDRSMDVEAQLWQAFDELGRTRGIGHRRRDLIPADLYVHYSAPYMIVYRRDVDPIHVLAILHGSRDIAKILFERTQ